MSHEESYFAKQGLLVAIGTGVISYRNNLSFRLGDAYLTECSYRFRSDYGGVQLWSSEQNDCALPGCTLAIRSQVC